MKALIVKDDGLIYAAEVPEEPRCGGKPYCCEGRPCDALHSGYIQAFTFAKESAVLCADQKKAEMLIVGDYISRRPNDAWIGLQPGIYPISDLQWEVKESWGPYHENTFPEKVAILKEFTPSTEKDE